MISHLEKGSKWQLVEKYFQGPHNRLHTCHESAQDDHENFLIEISNGCFELPMPNKRSLLINYKSLQRLFSAKPLHTDSFKNQVLRNGYVKRGHF